LPATFRREVSIESPMRSCSMKARREVSLLAIARKDWDPATQRAFARVGIHHLLVCAPTDDLLADDVDTSELAHRWNAYPILAEALKRITAADSLHRARAAANDALGFMPGGTNSRSGR